jgi:hypothetical protein
MSLGVVESGTQTATSDHALGSGSSASGVFTCNWNLTDMVDGDVIRCYVKAKTLTGDTPEVVYAGYYRHDNGGGNPLISSPPVVSMFSVQCGVEEIGSNSVSVPWSLVMHADYS